jgi:hypothetical protein
MSETDYANVLGYHRRLIAVCLKRGYKSGWIWYKMVERYGEEVAGRYFFGKGYNSEDNGRYDHMYTDTSHCPQDWV